MRIAFETLCTVEIQHAYYRNGCRDFDFLFPADTRSLMANGKIRARNQDGKLHLWVETDGEGNPKQRLTGKRLRIGLVLKNPSFSNFTVLPNLPASTLPVYRNEVQFDSLSNPIPAVVKDPPYAELYQEGVFAIVEILLSDALYGSETAFQISFDAKVQRLKYYVLAKNFSDAELNQLSIADTGFTEGNRPQLQFNRILAASFSAEDIAPNLLLTGSSTAKLVLFRSTELISRREQARTKVQLRRQNDVLIKNLPQPGISQGSSDLIIQITKP